MTVFIIGVLLALFFLGLIVPQKAFYSSSAQFEQWNSDHPVLSRVINTLHLNEIYVAPITVFFLCLFFANLLIVLIHRIPLTLRRAYIIERKLATEGVERVKDDPSSIAVAVDGKSPDDDRNRIAKRAIRFFRKRFWTVMAADDGYSFVAFRNRFSPLGFLLFHVSFLFCLVGGLLVMYTRFSGSLWLTEGEQFYSDISQFRVIKHDPKIFHQLPELGITLLGVFPSYEGGTGTDLNVSMKIKYFSETFDTVARINQPVKKGSVSILPQDVGVSPLFVLRKRTGEEVQGGYFSLNVLKEREDSFQFAGLPYTIFVKFYPDYTEKDGKPATKSLEIRNPVFRLRIEKQGQVLYEGFRKPGEWASVDSLEVSCKEIRYWVDFLVVREYGAVPLSTGFLIGAVGLVMRLVFFQKIVRVNVAESGGTFTLYIGGRSEYHQQMFKEELERIAEDLADSLKNGASGGKIA